MTETSSKTMHVTVTRRIDGQPRHESVVRYSHNAQILRGIPELMPHLATGAIQIAFGGAPCAGDTAYAFGATTVKEYAYSGGRWRLVDRVVTS